MALYCTTEYIQRLSPSLWDTRDNSYTTHWRQHLRQYLIEPQHYWQLEGFRSVSKRAGETVTTGPENRGPFKVSNCPCGVITMLAEVCGVLEVKIIFCKEHQKLVKDKRSSINASVQSRNVGDMPKTTLWLKSKTFQICWEPQLAIYFLNDFSVMVTYPLILLKDRILFLLRNRATEPLFNGMLLMVLLVKQDEGTHYFIPRFAFL